MKKKPTTKKAKPAVKRGPRTVEQAWREDTRASNGLAPSSTPTTAPPAAPTTPTESTPAPAAKPRPMARTHRRLASPAQRRGADLVRYLRIHAKRPYGTRGQNAIVALAREAAHLAIIELDARAQQN